VVSGRSRATANAATGRTRAFDVALLAVCEDMGRH
jgi:hypothetical protein